MGWGAVQSLASTYLHHHISTIGPFILVARPSCSGSIAWGHVRPKLTSINHPTGPVNAGQSDGWNQGRFRRLQAWNAVCLGVDTGVFLALSTSLLPRSDPMLATPPFIFHPVFWSSGNGASAYASRADMEDSWQSCCALTSMLAVDPERCAWAVCPRHADLNYAWGSYLARK